MADNKKYQQFLKRKEQKDKNESKNNQNFDFKQILIWVAIIVGVTYLFRLGSSMVSQSPREFKYGEYYNYVLENKDTHWIRTAVLTEGKIEGKLDNDRKYVVNIPESDEDLIPLLRKNIENFEVKPAHTLWVNLFYSLGPMLIFILFLWYFIYKGTKGGGHIMSFGKSKARMVSKDKASVTFDDVAGVEEAKEELQEIIEFLKDPKRFQTLGGRIPKGVLLVGHPGTGKTMLAKAVSGEAKVPFFSLSGSDFVEMFVGVGASRVRDLFEKAKKSAQVSGKGSIIFIDEIDAVGRQRFAGIGGGHDEREQTLNALLSEMDGFNTEEGVILIAATNRPDVLDPALLRPGRFDRQVVVDRPDIKGREAILKVHVRGKKIAKSVSLKSIARQTPGFSGADIANLVNEAALLAARKNKKSIGMSEFQASVERVMAGPERKSRVINEYEKKIVAYHESGHALLSLLISETDPLHKVSIIPRGSVGLGYTMQVPLEDRHITTKKELMGRLAVLLGGRVSEEINFQEITTGAHNDLKVATDIARRMVCEFGMSEKLGHLTFGKKNEPLFLGRDLVEEKDYSEQTAIIIDEEVKNIIDKSYSRAKKLLSENKDKLKKLAEELLEKETLIGEQVEKIVGILVSQKEAEQENKEEQKNTTKEDNYQ